MNFKRKHTSLIRSYLILIHINIFHEMRVKWNSIKSSETDVVSSMLGKIMIAIEAS